MFSKNVKKSFAVLFGMAVLSFSVTGCGGSSSSGDISTAPAESEQVSITEENKDIVISSAFSAFDDESIDVPMLGSSISTRETLNSVSKLLGQPTLQKTAYLTQGLKTASETGTEECPDGGTVVYDGTEAGGTAIYNDCTYGSVVIDGTMSFSESANTYTVTLTDFTQSIDGEVFFSINLMKYEVTYDDSYNLTSLKMTLDGSLTSYNDEKLEFNNYTLTYDLNGDILSMTANGYIKNSCLGAWIQITTNTAIQVDDLTDTCPFAGKITIGGNGSSIVVTFNADESATVDVNGVITEYTSCDDIPEGSCNI